ncbi:hypothetical protein [uncultured Clostridium sp.]|nr:hypothetical protein [uncultured Clostridium sp.]
MKEKTKKLLKEAQEICDREDRSTEYMIQFMQDYANVSFDCVINYLQNN